MRQHYHFWTEKFTIFINSMLILKVNWLKRSINRYKICLISDKLWVVSKNTAMDFKVLDTIIM